jgi:hypothetical protein
MERIIPTFADAEVAMLAGSSAGGIGTLLNATYFADGFIDQGKGVRIVILDDAGPFFEDEFLDVCIQKRYRDLFGLDESFPKDCTGCVTEEGGGLAKGILNYLQNLFQTASGDRFLREKRPQPERGRMVDGATRRQADPHRHYPITKNPDLRVAFCCC